MVRLINTNQSITGSEAIYCEFAGLSTDTKPTSVAPFKIAQGSIFTETDTGDVYMYDEENETWEAMFCIKASE